MFIFPISAALAGEVLYNGIELPDEWPPKNIPMARKPMPVPYLESRNIPKVIPIDVGRQLLVDDFLIDKTDLARTFHKATPYKGNPVLTYDQPWEIEEAYPYAGGMWYDASDQLFKAWYNAGKGRWGASGVGYATSKDGIHWHKPSLDAAIKGTSCVLHGKSIDSTTIWLDYNAKSPEERFKMMYNRRHSDKSWHAEYRTSPDGIRWSPVLEQPETGNDFDLFCYNPFRKKWVYLQRTIIGGQQGRNPKSIGRARTYREGDNLRKLIAEAPYRCDDMEKSGPPKGSVLWCGSDDLDPRNPDKKWAHLKPQMYNLTPGAYESLMIGMFAIWTGPPNKVLYGGGQKRCDILMGFSRDGFHWDRSSRKRFISPSWKRGTWDYGNAQPVTNCSLVVGDKLYIYYSARAWGHVDFKAATGLATLRRDGFASMDADKKTGTLTTRPLTFKGKYLFVNVDCPEGKLRAEVLDKDGNLIAPFSLANSVPVKADSTLTEMTWKGGKDLSELAGKPVRFRFHLKNGSLYAFWVSPAKSGASHGYVAAGGPGFTGPTDTVGQSAVWTRSQQ